LGVDEQMEGDTRYFYRRFMDDVIVLAKTRWHLRKAVKIVNQHFYQLKIEQAPDKTFIGKISRGVFQASCLSPYGPAKAVQNGSRQFGGFFELSIWPVRLSTSRKNDN
jgi:hypothetical protein